VVDLGVVGRNMALSLEQAVIDHEYYKSLQRFLEGVRVTEETIGEDVVDAAGPGGNFLAEEHTVKHHAAENWYSDIFRPEEYQTWIDRGRPDALDMAREKVAEICTGQMNPVLPPDRVKAVNEVVREAERCILGADTGLVPQ